MDAAAIDRFFQSALEGGRLVHAYLFLGSDEAVSVAQDLAAALLCRAPEKGRACTRCPDCRLVAAGSHPDLKVVAPEPSSIRIEQIRELRLSAGLTSFQGGRRVFLLKDAHKMTGDAANCLLKSLEEPTFGVFFILVAPSGEELAPTVVSRCQRFWIGGGREAGGDPGAATHIDAFVASWKERNVESLLRLVDNLAQDKDKKALVSFLDRLAVFFRDEAVRWEAAGSGGQSPAAAMVRCFERVEDARRRLSFNANARLLLDSLFLYLAGEAFGGSG